MFLFATGCKLDAAGEGEGGEAIRSRLSRASVAPLMPQTAESILMRVFLRTLKDFPRYLVRDGINVHSFPRKIFVKKRYSNQIYCGRCESQASFAVQDLHIETIIFPRNKRKYSPYIDPLDSVGFWPRIASFVSSGSRATGGRLSRLLSRRRNSSVSSFSISPGGASLLVKLSPTSR